MAVYMSAKNVKQCTYDLDWYGISYIKCDFNPNRYTSHNTCNIHESGSKFVLYIPYDTLACSKYYKPVQSFEQIHL